MNKIFCLLTKGTSYQYMSGPDECKENQDCFNQTDFFGNAFNFLFDVVFTVQYKLNTSCKREFMNVYRNVVAVYKNIV